MSFKTKRGALRGSRDQRSKGASILQKRLAAAVAQLVMAVMCLSVTGSGWAANVPPGFTETIIPGPSAGSWTQAVGVTFDPSGRMFVWERIGRVWTKGPTDSNFTQVLDISQEVGSWGDFGLVGFALDPNFQVNGRIYLLYVVDRHHLLNFGTGSYNANSNEYNAATIGRLTRYTCQVANNYQVDLASRVVLIGSAKTNGIPICSDTHGVGSLVFGQDGTLLISTGDGATANAIDLGGAAGVSTAPQALADGIIRSKENIGGYRSQLVDCLSGKVLRIDPATGNGLASNPYYDSANPQSARSRVWTLGMRNPFRATLRPLSGSHNPADGNPGVLYVGEVGWDNWDSLKVITGPGKNMGWPMYEGLTFTTFGGGSAYHDVDVYNQDAPNPLYPGGGCNQYFSFRQLLKEDTANAANFPPFNNPCNAGQKIPGTIPQFLRTRPVLDWNHDSAITRTPTFDASGNATLANVGGGGSPVSGTQFKGNCSVGGTWYDGTAFPSQYQNTYFHADWGQAVIKNMVFDANNKPVAVNDFMSAAGAVACIVQHPSDGSIYYVSYNYGDAGTVRRVSYTGNRTPVPVASANTTYGPGPLTVQFNGSGSSDPDNQALTYSWNFGDGTAVSTAANPSHTFTPPNSSAAPYTVTLTVTDSGGLSASTSLLIVANNTPPAVTITSPINGALYSMAGNTTFNLTATVFDAESSDGQLAYSWQTLLHHNNHDHVVNTSTSHTSSTVVEPIGCDGVNMYHFRVILTVTDPAGLATTREVGVFPNCGTTDTPPTISDIGNQSVGLGVATAAIPFTIGDGQVAAANLQLSGDSSNLALVPLNNIVFGGSGANRTVTVTPASSINGTSLITVTVNDGPNSVSDTFLLTVTGSNSPPTISTIANQTTGEGAPTAPNAFTVADVNTPAGNLVVSGFAANATLVPPANFVFGGSGSNRTVSVTPAPGQTGSTLITVVVSDGQLSTSNSYTLTVQTVATKSFTNTSAITIPDSGAATPYPSVINVAGVSGTISTVTVTLRNLSQTYASDVDVLLVGPGGQKVLVMSDTGSGSANNVTLTLSDAAAASLPAANLVSGTFKPTNLSDASGGGDNFPSPSPAGPYAAALSAFNGTDANGAWSLYVFDDGPGDQGSFAGGWSLTITTTGGGPVLPAVTVAATDATGAEPSDPGTFTFSRTGSTTAELTVNYTVAGTASSGSDYTSIGTAVTFAVGSATAIQTVSVLNDALEEGSETVVLTLAAGSGYTVGAPAVATVTINDDDAPALPAVTVAATDATGAEPGDPGTFTFSRTGSTAATLTVNYTVGGTASSGSDYTSIGTTVTFGAGSATATQNVSVLNDALVEGSETVVLTLATGSGYSVGAPAVATVTISDDEVSSGGTQSFTNLAAITIPDSGAGTPYPSVINVVGMSGTISTVTVTLRNLSHTYASDVDVLLVGPGGQKVLIMSDAGEGNASNVTLTLSDPAAAALPAVGLVSGTFQPTNLSDTSPGGDNFPAPAPAGPYAAAFSAFNGTDANGAWSLYVFDDGAGDLGSVAGGWSLAITTQVTTGSASPTISDIPDQSTTVNTAIAATPFTINDTDTPVGNLTLSASSSNPTLAPTNNIVFGGSGANRTVTVTPATGQTGMSTITVTVSDGTTSASDSFLLTVGGAQLTVTGISAADKVYDGTTDATLNTTLATLVGVANGDDVTLVTAGAAGAKSLTNLSAIVIPSASITAAAPYPSTINMTGMGGNISSVTVTLRNLTHPWMRDLDILLVGPTGQAVVLASDVGGNSGVNNLTFTLSDSAASALPTVAPFLSGTYRPANYVDASAGGDNFPSPAPAGPWGTTLSAYNGTGANGTWSLYVYDDGAQDGGSLAGGWSLTVTTTGVTTGATGAFVDANAGNGKSVTVSGLTLSGADAGNYTLVQPTTTANITPIGLTVTGITAADKVYDGTVAATLGTGSAALVGVLGVEVVTLGTGSATGTFANEKAGISKVVQVAGLTLGGADAGNYTVTQPTTAATITAKTVTPVIVANDKPYDGNTTATLSSPSVTGTIGADIVTLGVGAANFDTMNVGIGKTVTAAALSLGGADAGNYVLGAASATDQANIVGKTVTPVIVANDKPYDGTTTATLGSQSVTGTIGAEVVTLSVGAANFDNKNAGTGKTVTATTLSLGGANAGNYVLSAASATDQADITAKAVTPVIVANDKPYDGNTTATLSSQSVSGNIGAEVVTLSVSTANFDTKNVGTGKTVTATTLSLSGADAGNYVLGTASATDQADITAKAVTPVIVANDKPYDGNTTATLSSQSVTGTIGDEVVTLSVGAANFDTKNASTGKTVTATTLSLSGADAGNYVLGTASASDLADITAKVVTPVIVANDKFYDGNTTATLSSQSVTGTIGADIVTLGVGAANFDNKNAGSGKTVTATTLSLGGANAGNYALSMASASDLADITAKAVTPVIVANDKLYDGNTTAALSSRSVTGTIGADIVTLGVGAANFDTKNAGTGKTVTASTLSLGGADAGNYVLGTASATDQANITAKAVTPVIVANDKLYDGHTLATLRDRLVIGTIGADVVVLGVGAANFDNKNAGTGKTVTATTLSLGGADAGNYVLSAASATDQADITAKAVTPVIVANDKPYDGNATATLGSQSVTGTIGADIATLGVGAANFDTKNAGTGKTVTATTLSLGGADAGNYVLSAASAIDLADITRIELTVTADDKSRAYGAANPTLTATFTGFVSGETLATSGVTGSPALSTTANAASPVGSYPITAAVASLSAINYGFKFVNGTLVVTPSRPVILSLVGVGTTNVVITWSGISNLTYRVQCRTDLDGGDWFDLVTGVSATNDTVSAVDNVGDAKQRYYRVVTE